MGVGGATVLKLFGISLPVVQLAGGLVLAAMGWGLLNQKEAVAAPDSSAAPVNGAALQGKSFTLSLFL